jgi:hypothetical protein
VPSIDERATQVLEQAKELAGRVENWAEFSNLAFAPEVSLAARAFPYSAAHLHFGVYPSTHGRRPERPRPVMRLRSDYSGPGLQPSRGRFTFRPSQRRSGFPM